MSNTKVVVGSFLNSVCNLTSTSFFLFFSDKRELIQLENISFNDGLKNRTITRIAFRIMLRTKNLDFTLILSNIDLLYS